jgi:hypothetical protein
MAGEAATRTGGWLIPFCGRGGARLPSAACRLRWRQVHPFRHFRGRVYGDVPGADERESEERMGFLRRTFFATRGI